MRHTLTCKYNLLRRDGWILAWDIFCLRSINSKNSFAFEFLFFKKNLQDRFFMAVPHMSSSTSKEQLFLEGVVMRTSKSVQNAPTASLIICSTGRTPYCFSSQSVLPAPPSLEVIRLTFSSPLLADIWLLAAESEAAVSAESTLLCESCTVSTGKLFKGHGWMLAVSVLLEHHSAKWIERCLEMLHHV